MKKIVLVAVGAVAMLQAGTALACPLHMVAPADDVAFNGGDVLAGVHNNWRATHPSLLTPIATESESV